MKGSYSRRQELLLLGFAVFFWFSTAVGGYQTVWLQEKGITSAQLGVINAVSSGIGILVITLTGFVSDRVGSLVKTMLLCLVLGFGSYALIPLLPSEQLAFPVFVLLLSALTIFRSPMMSLAENLLVRNCNELTLNYGRIRSVASLTYCLGGLAAAALIGWLGTGSTFWVSGLLGIPAIALTAFIRDPDGIKERNQSNMRQDAGKLLHTRAYLILIASVFFYQIGHTCRFNYLPYYMRGVGLDSGNYGILFSYSAILEIPSLLILSSARKRFSLHQLLIFSLVLQLAEVVLLGTCCSSMVGLILISTLYGLGNGLHVAVVLNYVYTLAPVSLRASAQAFYQAVASVANIFGNLVGGIAFGLLGAKPFYLSLGVLYILSVILLTCNSPRNSSLTAEQP